MRNQVLEIMYFPPDFLLNSCCFLYVYNNSIFEHNDKYCANILPEISSSVTCTWHVIQKGNIDKNSLRKIWSLKQIIPLVADVEKASFCSNWWSLLGRLEIDNLNPVSCGQLPSVRCDAYICEAIIAHATNAPDFRCLRVHRFTRTYYADDICYGGCICGVDFIHVWELRKWVVILMDYAMIAFFK